VTAAHGKTAVLPFDQTIYAFLASMQIDVALFGLGLRGGFKMQQFYYLVSLINDSTGIPN